MEPAAWNERLPHRCCIVVVGAFRTAGSSALGRFRVLVSARRGSGRCPMSISAMTWAWGLRDLGQAETLVLLALADAADDDGLCWPSQAVVARKARISERSVRRHIAFLREAGLVDVETRSSLKGRRSNLYRLNVGADYERVPAVQAQPANLAGCDSSRALLPVDNSDRRRSPATGQSGRLQTQPVAGDLSLEVMGGRLLPYGGLNRNSEPPDQTRPANQSTATNSVLRGSSPEGSVGVEDDDLSTLGACLPERMQVLDSQGRELVLTLLEQRLEVGWQPWEIRAALDQPLPGEGVVRMSGLVASRLERNVDPGASPSSLRASASRARQGSRLRPVQLEPADLEWDQAWEWVLHTYPDARRREQLTLAQERLGTLQGGKGA